MIPLTTRAQPNNERRPGLLSPFTPGISATNCSISSKPVVTDRPQDGTVIRFLANTGLRWGEMAAVMVGKGRDDLMFTSHLGEVLRVSTFRVRHFGRRSPGAGRSTQCSQSSRPTI